MLPAKPGMSRNNELFDFKSNTDYLFRKDINGFAVNSIDISKKTKICVDILQSEDVPTREKLKVGFILCDSLYGIIRHSADTEKIICQKIGECINDTQSCPKRRISYIMYRNQDVATAISHDFYLRGIGDVLPIEYYILIMKHVLKTSRCHGKAGIHKCIQRT